MPKHLIFGTYKIAGWSFVLQFSLILGVFLVNYFSDPVRYIEFEKESQGLSRSQIDASLTKQVSQKISEEELAEETEPTVRSIRHEVKPGETISSICKKYSSDCSTDMSSAFKEAGVSLSSIRAGEVLRIRLSMLGEVLGLRKSVAPTKVLVLNTSEEKDGFTHHFKERRVRSKDRSVSGLILSSLAESARLQDIPYEVVDDVVDLFASRIDFRKDLHSGDRFTVIFSENRLPNDKLVGTGPIKAAVITRAGKKMVAIRYQANDSAEASYYDEKGNILGNYFLRYPVKFTRISSSFSHARFHPVLKIKRPHNGVDFAAPVGTPVRTVADGIVTYSGYNRAGGYTVKIKHSAKYSTAYLHLSKIEAGIITGRKVSRGQQIGRVGMTGLATGPHLHYSLYENNNYIDPMKVNLPSVTNSNATIPAGYLKSVLADLDKADHDLRLAKKGQDESLG